MTEDRSLIEQIADLTGPLPDIDDTFLVGWEVGFIVNTDGRVSNTTLRAPNGE